MSNLQAPDGSLIIFIDDTGHEALVPDQPHLRAWSLRAGPTHGPALPSVGGGACARMRGGRSCFIGTQQEHLGEPRATTL